MIISVSSNIINGVYSCLEVLLIVALTRILTTITGCWNVKTIYDDEKELHLRGSLLPFFAELGITSKFAQRLGLLVFVTVIILLTVGEFAIVGVSEDTYEDFKVRNLIKKAPRGQLLNLSEHLNPETGQISGALMVFKDISSCGTRTTSEVLGSQFTNELDDMTTVKWGKDEVLHNSSCLQSDDGFKNEVAFSRKVFPPPEEYSQDICQLTLNASHIPPNSLTAVEPPETSCPFPILEIWCYQNGDLFCTILQRLPVGFVTSLLRGALVSSDPQEHMRLGDTSMEERPESQMLQSMTMMLMIGMLPLPLDLEIRASLTWERDVFVKKITGKMESTKINFVLLGLTAGTAIVIIIVMGLLASGLWVWILVLPGRLECNRFSSAMDLLSYASSLAFDGMEKLRRDSGVVIGIDANEPHVGPLQAYYSERTSTVDEDELVGRCK